MGSMHFISHIMRINSLALLFILGFGSCKGQRDALPAKQVLNRVIELDMNMPNDLCFNSFRMMDQPAPIQLK